MHTIDFQAGIAGQELDHFIVDIVDGIGNSGNVFVDFEIGITDLLDNGQECRINSGAGKDLGNHVGGGGNHCFRH
ncbi:hypothetical protein c7_L51 [Megavirus courdo7]|uniref:Uncharacterized protein n=1 Tax=Megavirus courdo7 TaxID=1128135 RepID=H2E9P4_9VIRU|nr:hypothetical protein c7_L51 [Megavirus courdo7]